MRRDEFPIVEEYCKDKIIEELEKIKGKIIINDNFEWVFSGRKFIEKKAILDIIDKEISELKGENK